MTDPKLRAARIAEAKRRVTAADPHDAHNNISRHIAEMRMLSDLIEADWRPEPEVDAVTLAAREWMKEAYPEYVERIDSGHWKDSEAIFRAGHDHAMANHLDAKRMDWLEGQLVTVWERGILHDQNPSEPLRAKIDRAMEGGQ